MPKLLIEEGGQASVFELFEDEVTIGRGASNAVQVADALRAFIAKPGRAEALAPIRKRALDLGLTDIALASFVLQSPGDISDTELALLARLTAVHKDAWWRAFEHQHGHESEPDERDGNESDDDHSEQARVQVAS